MNKKQKKEKRLRAKHHTKSQAQIHTTHHEEDRVLSCMDEFDWFALEIDQPVKKTKYSLKWCLLAVIILILTCYMFYIG